MRYTSQSPRKTRQSQKLICTATSNEVGQTQKFECVPLNGAMAQASNYSIRNFHPSVQGSTHFVQNGKGKKCNKCGDCHLHGNTSDKLKYETLCRSFGRKRYVKHGAPPGGNGKKNSPWNSLTQAQNDETWQTLYILYSPTPLNEGIRMRPGTTIIGKSNHSYGTDSSNDGVGAQAMITNTNVHSNGGNAILIDEPGTYCIRNIHLIDPSKSGIRYDVDSKSTLNITAAKVLITGHNQSNSIESVVTYPIYDLYGRGYPFNAFMPEIYALCGIDGIVTTSGKTILYDVTIRNNYTGHGYHEAVHGGANREISIQNCTFTELYNRTLESDFLSTRSFRAGAVDTSQAIQCMVSGENSNLRVHISDTVIHDLINEVNSSREFNFNRGVFLESSRGANLKSKICGCTMRYLEDVVKRPSDLGSTSVWNLSISGGEELDEFGNFILEDDGQIRWNGEIGQRTRSDISIKCSTFEEDRYSAEIDPSDHPGQIVERPSNSVLWYQFALSSDNIMEIYNNDAVNFEQCIRKINGGTTGQVLSVLSNKVTGLLNEFIYNETFDNLGDIGLNDFTTIEDNYIEGLATSLFGGEYYALNPGDFSSTPDPYLDYTVNATRNCVQTRGYIFIDDFPPSSAFYTILIGFPGSSIGNATYNVYENNFIGHFTSIIDVNGLALEIFNIFEGTGSNYYIADNYWGGGPADIFLVFSSSGVIVSNPYKTNQIPLLCDVDGDCDAQFSHFSSFESNAVRKTGYKVNAALKYSDLELLNLDWFPGYKSKGNARKIIKKMLK